MNFSSIEKNSQKTWEDEKLFSPEIDSEKKGFYIQVAYPYPSGAMHIGHAKTYTTTDIIAKYKMLAGYNVLMPMGWHVSGTPVLASVEKLKEKDSETVKIFTENFKIPEKDLKKMHTPDGLVNYMVDEAEYGYKKGMKILGFGIDWRRELKTIDEQYKKFIEWQYEKLNQKKLIGKGKYPIRYSPKDKMAVGDHDLKEGEGIGIQEFTLLKFKLEGFKNRFLVAATLRPETVYGQTNLWLNPEYKYTVIKTGKEEWILSEKAAEKLIYQKENIKKIGKMNSRELLGEKVEAPGIDRKIPIWPASFCDPEIGSGIVTSVPSDAPIDMAALIDLQSDESIAKKHGLDFEEIKNTKIIPIIKTKKFGENAGEKILKEMNIKNQKELDKLEKAKEIVYKEGFHSGVMLEAAGKFKGLKVSKAKDLIKEELIKQGKADLFFELEGKVVSRSGGECVVRLLDDQWFVKYGNKEWKKNSKKDLDGMKIVPEVFRKQYEQIFNWLDDKPLTRAKGLGTKFPWQKDQVIEPLGDSTVYMAYFTIAHLINTIEAQKLNDEFFDFIFLGKGSAKNVADKTGLKVDLIEELKKNFDYWYPLAFNVSAIELIPNHMSFSIFQHNAIFPQNKRQIGTINLGMLILEGKKMSSSKGNVILINDICKKMGTDYVRFSLMNFVEPWEEMNWQSKEVSKGIKNLNNFVEQIFKLANSVDEEKIDLKKLNDVDKWFLNRINFRINNYIGKMNEFELRSALQEMSFNLAKDFKWYKRRNSKLNNAIIFYFVKNWCKIISPFMPHLAEELWRHVLKQKNSVFLSGLPEKQKIDKSVGAGENLIEKVLDDVIAIKALAKIEKPKKIVFYIADEWKWNALKLLKKVDRPDFGLVIKTLMADKTVKKQGKTAQLVAKEFSSRLMEFKDLEKIDEEKILNDSKEFLLKELNAQKIEIFHEKKSGFDPQNKAVKSMPGKPAIYLE